MKLVRLLSFLAVVMLLSISDTTAQITTDTLGTGTSSSATRGPFQRSDTASSSVYSRAQLMYSQTELATTLGIPSGATISQINWDLGSTNVITATGTATLNIYMKNSMVTDAVIDDTWADITMGSTLVGTYTFDATTNNFPGAKGLMSFVLATPFVYTGNTIEVAVDWDCSGLTTTSTSPVNANKLFDGNGSLNWHWDATAHVSTLYRAGGSSAPTILNKLKSERVNTQFVYSVVGSAVAPSLPIDFEDTVGVDHAMVDFGDNASVFAVDPTDPNNIVVKSEKKTGAQTWAGTVVADNGLVNAVPFTATATKMSVRVWSPDAGTDFLLKLEKAGTPADAVETLATTTLAGQWETLVFDFNNHVAGTPALDLTKVYDKIVFFPDFGNAGTGKVYYWDDVMMDMTSSNFDVSVMADFDIMPNPANNFVQLQFNNEYVSVEKTVSVYNSVGQVVFTNVVNHMNSYEVNTSDFAKGMYYVTVQAADGVKTKRLVVIH